MSSLNACTLFGYGYQPLYLVLLCMETFELACINSLCQFYILECVVLYHSLFRGGKPVDDLTMYAIQNDEDGEFLLMITIVGSCVCLH